MFKHMSGFVSFIMCLLSLGCPARNPSALGRQKPVYPDKDLREIVISGSYSPEDKKALEELKTELLKNERCNRGSKLVRCEYNSLSVGETLEEALKNRFSDVGKEGFTYSYSMYCYNETKHKESGSVKKNLKARLYSKEGKLLSERFLILDKSSNHEIHYVVAYLPYHDEGHKILIVRLKGNKEVILDEINMLTQSELQKESEIDNSFFRAAGHGYWLFNEESECHTSPPVR